MQKQHSSKSDQTGSTHLVAILAVVVVLAIGVIGWKVWQNSNDIKAVQDATKATTSSKVADQTKTDETPKPAVVTIKELGITLTGPETLADLTYSYKATTTEDGKQELQAYLSSKSLTAFDAGCAADGAAPPLGSIAKVTGQYPTNPTAGNSVSPLVKQFPTYYIGGPVNAQAACAAKDYPTTLDAKTKTLKADLLTALKSVKEQ